MPVPCEALASLFERQVDAAPEHPAAVFGEQEWSYAELDERANRLANYLIGDGVRGAFVGICSDRREDLTVAALAAVKAGAVAVPLDPAYPARRLAWMVRDAAVATVVTRRRFDALLPAAGVPIVRLDVDAPQVAAAPAARPGRQSAAQPACLMYTSGSTGEPKGVLVPQAGVVRLVVDAGYATFDDLDRVAFAANFSFDASLFELWGALLNGATLVAVPRHVLLSPRDLVRFVRRSRITTMFLTTTLFNEVVRAEPDAFVSVRQVVVGGEAADPGSMRAALRHVPGRLVNGYGPTETTTFATAFDAAGLRDGAQTVPIGWAVPRTTLYVLDERLRPVPDGAPGELFIGGAGVALGYWRRPGLTAAAFLPDPFAGGGARMYRTGDLVRRGGSGLEFIGRRDWQVKIRGFRVELGEVEAALREHPALDAVVATVREDRPGDRRLVAYLLPGEQVTRHVPAVRLWRTLFDETYAGPGDAGPAVEPSFDATRWVSSYGTAFSGLEIAEWELDTLPLLRELPHKRVLEVGCGAGNVARRLAPDTAGYVATDFSAAALDRLRARLAADGGAIGQLTLLHTEADALQDTGRGFDLALLESVVQFFPDLDYLRRVLEDVTARVRDGGTVVVADVRNLALLDHFHASLNEPGEHSKPGELEDELVVHPDWFAGLPREIPRLGHVEVRLKRGTVANELTRYRYDVVLHVGPVARVPEVRWVPWAQVGSLDRLAALAASSRWCAVRDVPNARLAAGGVEPEDVWRLAGRCGRRADVLWAGPDTMDAVLGPAGGRRPVPRFERPAATGPLANAPQWGQLRRRLPALVREFAAATLPPHLVPSAFVVLRQLPLTPNGKLDRARLPAPAAPNTPNTPNTPAIAAAAAGPAGGPAGEPAGRADEAERLVARIWAEVLGVEDVGPADNFFALGGHSLLATQVVSRIRRAFQVDLPLRQMLEGPTVAGLAEAVRTLSRQRAGSSAGSADAVPPVRAAQHGGSTAASFGQERFWFLERLRPGNAVYNLPFAYRLRGPLDVRALRGAIDELVGRHEALRTAVVTVGGRATQVVVPPAAVELRIEVAPDGPDAGAELARLLRQEARRPFDLGAPPLLRALLVRAGPDDHVLLITTHHIVSDGWSQAVVDRELAAAYAGEPLPDLPVSYRDFTAWQRERLTGDVLAGLLAYWRQQLAGAPELLALPADRPRPAAQSFRGATYRFRLPEALAGGLERLGHEHDATLFMVLLAGLNAVLHRLTGAEDLVVGTAIANRIRPELEGLVGFFVNTLALRTSLAGDPAFTEVLRRAREVALGAYVHQELPFEKLVEELELARDLSYTPLVQVLLVLQNAGQAGLRLPGLDVRRLHVDHRATQFDLVLSVERTGDGIDVLVEYSTDLFDEATVARFGGHLRTLLTGAVAAPGTPVSALPMLTGRELAQLRSLNATEQANPGPLLLHELIEAQARRTPDATAVVYEGRRLTYAELDELAGRVAGYLVARGVGPEQVVAVAMPRGLDLPVAMLAVLKAGGAYLPVDPAYPRARRELMLSDAGAAVVLTGLPPDLGDRPGERPRVLPQHPAYLIYTSGSTGRPKGVVVPHAGIVNLCTDRTLRSLVRPGERISVWASASFDASIYDLVLALTRGGAAHIVPEHVRVSTRDYLRWLAEHRIDGGYLPPFLVAEAATAARLPALRGITLATEPVPAGTFGRLAARLDTCEAVSAYGPTEASIAASAYRVPDPPPADGILPIGRPLANVRLHVLDRGGAPVPALVIGELWIAGAGLARGYHGDPGLTADRFRPDPFGPPGSRMYRSGDLAWHRPDGELVFAGRVDSQVKVRGLRIEPSEVVAALERHPAVADAHVTVRGGQLVAYVAVPEPEQPAFDPAALRRDLATTLPRFLVPAQIVVLPALPLLPNGKLDTDLLPAPQVAAATGGRAPRTAAERLVARVWSGVLGVRSPSVTDDFFR
ncbi:MAG TPA: amino acid adenylation domain-containing protein, partial [Pseudonocardiaceae bacterium]|nr:amino acid adenylation domain-containing protein [Pseudonocardiaceae bacterium]